ncbi:MAG: type 2 lantipeptide synthetase LanM [Parachlamydia sp.]|nr:type 2 lantipeptide synthetase LanM [Parachlamydia sp.]
MEPQVPTASSSTSHISAQAATPSGTTPTASGALSPRSQALPMTLPLSRFGSLIPVAFLGNPLAHWSRSFTPLYIIIGLVSGTASLFTRHFSLSALRYPCLTLASASAFMAVTTSVLSWEDRLTLAIQRRFSTYGVLQQPEDAIMPALTALIDHVCQLVPPAAQNEANRRHLEGVCLHALKMFQSYCHDNPTTDVVVQQERLKQFHLMIFHRTNDFHRNLHQICTQCEHDANEIKMVMPFVQRPNRLVIKCVELLEGETHAGGLKVCKIQFNGNVTCLYKPRDIRIDQAICSSVGFHSSERSTHPSLFGLINQLSGREIFPNYHFLAKPGCGYVQYLSHAEEDTTLTFAELRQYCRTLGSLQALAQIFGIRDLHAQNLIPHQRRPHPVDLEAFANTSVILRGDTTELYLALALRVPPHEIFLHEGETINQERRIQLQQDLQEGFADMINICAAQTAVLQAWVRALPDDLLLRYIPLPTSQLQQWLDNMPHLEVPEHQSLLDAKGIEMDYERLPEYQHLAVHMQEDLWHGDVPIMHLNLAGQVLHRNRPIFRLTEGRSMRQFLIDNLNPPRIQNMRIEAQVVQDVMTFITQIQRR